jgi:hypothetical protein
MIILWGVLLAILAWGGIELLRDPARFIDNPPPAQTLDLPEIVVPMVQPVPLDQFAAIVQRPVFFAGRRLPQPTPIRNAPDTALTRVALPRAQLTAILADGPHQRRVLLSLPRGKERALVLGDMIDGWRLSQIGTDEIVLTANEQQYRMKLYDFPDETTRPPPPYRPAMQ